MFFKKSKVPPTQIMLEKWHALGNDFLISYNLKEFSSQKIKQLSDRNFGIGCDQFITINQNRVRFFNSDGTESGLCGNALKCIGLIVSRETKQNNFILEANNKNIDIKIQENNFVSGKIGKPFKFKEEGNPFLYLQFEEQKKKKDVNYDFFKLIQSNENHFYFVDLGNPHFVCILNLSEKDPLLQRKSFDTFLSSQSVGDVINFVGEALQREYLKTSGVNVSFVIIESEKEVYVRTFERGVGETLSCGSGASASVFCGIKLGIVSRETVKVFNRGSEKVEEIESSFSVISLDNEENIWLSGKGVKIGNIIISN